MKDPAPHSIEIGEWKLLPERMALHLGTGSLVVADLHLGYSRERANRGDAVPVPTLDEELAPLRAAWRREQPNSLIFAGDLVEKARTDLARAAGAWLQQEGIRVAGLVRGNHDGHRVSWPFPVLPDGHPLGRYQIWHHWPNTRIPVVHGHEHPALPLPGLGLVPCFLLDESRLVLPAYSCDAAGGNIFRRKDLPDIRSMNCLAVAGTRVENLSTVGDLEKALVSRKGRPK